MIKNNLNYFIHTFGCQANISDSEKIAALLENTDYKKAQKLIDADLIIINTCSVRQSAENRVFGMIENLKKLKKVNPGLIVGVTGCMANLYPKRLSEKVDFIFDIRKLDDLVVKIQGTREQNNKRTCLLAGRQKNENPETRYLKLLPKHSSPFHAYIPIMSGCNNFCSYCVVPYARGREMSRPSREIIKEVQKLINQGYKAITLIGQNVNSYGRDLKEKTNFPKLLKQTENIPGNFWIWFITSHPKDMSDELIKTVASSKKICPYIHLPAQVGSDKILKAMNRGYTKAKYTSLVKKIRKEIKNCGVSTDVIVGFPGETKNDFKETCKLFNNIKFDMAYIAKYSKRPKTAAFKLKDNISPLEKTKRKIEIDKILKKTALENNQKLVGKTLDVLVEKGRGGEFRGKTKTLKTVIIKFNLDKKDFSKLIGKIVKVQIEKARDFSLEGNLIS
jgi:tRNA-2-methylthio-N6-dimethylallyladenosine synthase